MPQRLWQQAHYVERGERNIGAVLVLQLARNVEYGVDGDAGQVGLLQLPLQPASDVQHGDDTEPSVLLQCCRRRRAKWNPGVMSTRSPAFCSSQRARRAARGVGGREARWLLWRMTLHPCWSCCWRKMCSTGRGGRGRGARRAPAATNARRGARGRRRIARRTAAAAGVEWRCPWTTQKGEGVLAARELQPLLPLEAVELEEGMEVARCGGEWNQRMPGVTSDGGHCSRCKRGQAKGRQGDRPRSTPATHHSLPVAACS